jgi:acyl-CoA synthetase (AMP-forming)/AMP-acid ligase II
MTDPDTLCARSALHARQRPDHQALIYQDRAVTYRQLHQDSNAAGHALRSAGLRPGARVAYLGQESERYWEIALGCAKAGLVLVPINWRLTGPEVDHILRDSRAELLFVEGEFLAAADRARDGLGALRTVVRLDADGDRTAGFLAWRGDAPTDDLPCVARTDDPVVQMYTSGTSGLPKGVVLAHRTFFTFIAASTAAGVDWIDWRPDDRSLTCFTGLHSAGMAWFMHVFNVGGTNLFMPSFVPEEAVRLIAEHRLTTVWAAPAMLRLMLGERRAGRDAFGSLRKVVYGGSPIAPDLLLACIDGFGCELAQMYAAAETGSVVTALPPADHTPGNPKLGSAGRVCPGNRVRIVDEQGADLPPGTVGQVLLYSPARFVEYFDRPEATAAMLADGWLRMGDAGYLDADGYLYIRDRLDDTIIVAGQNIYPVEVENALRRHPAVADVAVVGVPDPRWGQRVHAFVVPRPGRQVTGRDLSRATRGAIADFKLPTGYSFVADLPRNPTGKVLRRVLREQFSWPGVPA